jgi:hypothetical protein
MNEIIDLGSELLVDQSKIRDPYLRILALALGQRLIHGSPWLAIDKSVVQSYKMSKQRLGGSRFRKANSDYKSWTGQSSGE